MHLFLKKSLVFAFFLIAAGACRLGGQATVPTQTPPASIPTGTHTAEPTLTPVATATPEPRPGLRIIGPEETVFDWTTDACEPEDIPDLPARAFRDADGQVHLVSAHIRNRAYVGPGLNEVVHSCDVIMESGHDPDPAMFNDNEWIAAVYTEDGETVYAVVHNEYHGWEHDTCTSSENFDCWYNAATLAVSYDGGKNFSDAAAPPDHFIAGLPHVYEDGAGPYGVMEPGSIVKKDGYYYQFVRIDDYRSDTQWICLMRTDDLTDPASWRAWDSEAFTVQFIDPYRHPDASREEHLCAPVSPDTLGVMNQSLTYNTFLERYVMLGVTADTIGGREVWGIYYSFSDDLLHWSHRQLLMEIELPWTYQPGDADYILYPALIDPESPSLSFETTGETAYLYFTRFNISAGTSPLDRDLIRIPVQFSLSE